MNDKELERWDAVWDRLKDMLGWKEGWDGYSALPPKPGSFVTTIRLVGTLQELVASNDIPAPNVTASADGEMVLEWWIEGKKYTLYISDDRDL